MLQSPRFPLSEIFFKKYDFQIIMLLSVQMATLKLVNRLSCCFPFHRNVEYVISKNIRKYENFYVKFVILDECLTFYATIINSAWWYSHLTLKPETRADIRPVQPCEVLSFKVSKLVSQHGIINSCSRSYLNHLFTHVIDSFGSYIRHGRQYY